MFFVMAIAGMVCTALSVSGQTITDLKTGYWLGSTPAAQERVKFLGVIAAAVAVGITIVMLAEVFQFGEAVAGDSRPVLAAPQASIMQALVQGFMNRDPIPYILFLAGAMITVAMEMLGVPALVFALGMYLPLDLNTPALVGGWLSHLVNKRSERESGARARTVRERGVIIASGLMAGGALGGVLGASLRLTKWYKPLIEEQRWRSWFFDNDTASSLVSIVLFLGLCIYLWVDSTRKSAEA
jgi:putative OPT family oligopeptide transporter